MAKIKRTVKDLLRLVKEAEAYRDEQILPQAKQNLAHLVGSYIKQQDKTDVSYTVNLAHSVLNTILTGIYSRVPEFMVAIKKINATGKEIVKSLGFPAGLAVQEEKIPGLVEEWIKQIYFDTNADETNRESIADTGWAGYGVTKTGYKYVFDQNKKKSILEGESSPSDMEISDVVKSNQPFVIRVNPMCILFDPAAPRLDRSQWYCEEIYADKEDVKEFYGVELPDGYEITSKNSIFPDSFYVNKVKLYEFHLLDETDPRVYVFSDISEDFLVDKQHPLFDKKTSKVKNVYQFIWFNNNPRGCYPIADLTLIANQLYEANTFINKRVEAIKKMRGMYVLTGNWDSDNISKFKEGDWGEVLHSMEAGAGASPILPIPLGQEYWQNIAAIEDEMYRVLGLTDYASGGSTQKRKATEAMIMDRAMSNRVNARIIAIQNFIYKQIDTVVEWIKWFQSVPRKVYVKDQDTYAFASISSDFLKSTDMDISIVSGSTAPMDQDSQRRRAEALVALSQGLGDIMNRTEVAREAIRTLGFRDTDRFLMQKAPSPMQVPGQAMGGTVPSVGAQNPAEGEITRMTQMGNAGAV